MKNIIITGASGFLGAKIYNYFNSNNLVCSVGRSLNNNVICDLSTNVPVFSNIFFDTVIHCAGKAHIVPKTQKEVNEFNEVNFIGTKNLIKGIDSIPKLPKSFIFRFW